MSGNSERPKELKHTDIMDKIMRELAEEASQTKSWQIGVFYKFNIGLGITYIGLGLFSFFGLSVGLVGLLVWSSLGVVWLCTGTIRRRPIEQVVYREWNEDDLYGHNTFVGLRTDYLRDLAMKKHCPICRNHVEETDWYAPHNVCMRCYNGDTDGEW